MTFLDRQTIKNVTLYFNVTLIAIFLCPPIIGAQESGPSAQATETDTDPPSWFVDRTQQPGHGTFIYVQTPRPFTDPMETEAALEEACVEQVRQSIENWHPHASDDILIDGAVIASELVYKDRFRVKRFSDAHTAELNRSLGAETDYHHGYAQLLLTDDFHKRVDRNWQTNQTKNRLTQFALIGLTVFGLLATLFGYLKLQTLTRGFYTGHLQFICIALIIGLVVMFFWLLKTL